MEDKTMEDQITEECEDSTEYDQSDTSDDDGELSAEYLERERKYKAAMKAIGTFTEEEIQRDLKIYDQQVLSSEGFDVDYFPSLSDYCCILTPYSNPNSEYIREYAELALNNFNKEKNSNYELGKVLKAVSQGVGLELIRVTFEGKDNSGDCKVFLGEVFEGIPDKHGNPYREVRSCILKPDQSQQKVA